MKQEPSVSAACPNLYVPAQHEVHWVQVFWPSSLNFPAAHAAHEDLPGAIWEVPAAQSVQWSAADFGRDATPWRPAAHAMHDTCAACDCHEPVLHAVQWSAEVTASLLSPNVPAAQDTHSSLHAELWYLPHGHACAVFVCGFAKLPLAAQTVIDTVALVSLCFAVSRSIVQSPDLLLKMHLQTTREQLRH